MHTVSKKCLSCTLVFGDRPMRIFEVFLLIFMIFFRQTYVYKSPYIVLVISLYLKVGVLRGVWWGKNSEAPPPTGSRVGGVGNEVPQKLKVCS